MRKVIPFTKSILFKTMLKEVTDIEVKHNLKLKDNNEIEGEIIINGKYKMTEASSIEEDFDYKFPFMIAIDSKYDTSNLEISIGDFYFEIINENELKVNIDINLDNLIDNDEVEIEKIRLKNEIEELDSPLEILEKEIKEDIKKEEVEEKDNTINEIINTNENNNEEYSTYYVYVVSENDTIESIIDKYKITKEDLENYNDISNIKIGNKLIIPCSND